MVTKDKCSGCSACQNICPVNAIELKTDKLTGFKLVEVDTFKCINCGNCDNVCPHNTFLFHDSREQEKYMMKSPDKNILNNSSSGGAFTHITIPLLKTGWKIVGVKWNNDWHAEYSIADSIDEWKTFRKSKYMQADLKDIFYKIHTLLKNGDKIVFVGVPCHVSGLLNYLGKKYDNLLTIDLICKSLCSPLVWDKWYNAEGLDKSEFLSIDMRHKCGNGKGNYTIHIEKKDGQIHNIMLPTTWIWPLAIQDGSACLKICESCKYRDLDRVSDITIGDMPENYIGALGFCDVENDNTSIIFCNSEKGKKYVGDLLNNTICKKSIDVTKTSKNYVNRNRDKIFEALNHNNFDYLNSLCNTEVSPQYDIAICGGTFNANFGATLTYYALYRYLEMMGKNVIILPPSAYKFNGGMYPGNVFEKYCNVADNYFQSNPIAFNNLANTFILGSDQMWNPKCALYTKLGLKSFLNYIKNNKKKIAYSVSTGGKIFPGTLNGDNKFNEIKRLLKKFDAISCREKDGCDLLREYTGINSEHTIDPVFLLPRKEYENLINDSDVNLPEEEYGCYYCLMPQQTTLDFFHELNKQLKLKEVIMGCGQPQNYAKYTDYLPNEKFANPINAQDWLKYIKNAKYVITNSFHCICFCIMFNIPFICLMSPNNIRINWILRNTELMSNYLKVLDINTAKDIINKPIRNFYKLNNFIEHSRKWLIDNLESK